MSLYEVKFYVRTKKELDKGETEKLSNEVFFALRDALPPSAPKPENRRVYVRREYETHEEDES